MTGTWLNAGTRCAFLTGGFMLLLSFHADAFRGAQDNLAQAGFKPAVRRELSPDQLRVAQLATQTELKLEWHPHLATPLSIRGKDLARRQNFSGGKGLLRGN